MYAAHFHLREMPFSILPDPRFLFFSRAHAMALSMLEYGVLNQAGFTVVTGAIGSGKTTLIRHLLGNIRQDIQVGLITQTPRCDDNLFEWLLLAFGRPVEGESYASLYKSFCDFVRDVSTNGGRVVLIIDEAQNLQAERLEELRMLSNMNAASIMLQLVLVGQPELSETLNSPKLRQFAQRVSSDFHLPRLMPSEVRDYINHRLVFAGGEPGLISPAAKRLIGDAADGIPRLINILADRCLAYAYGNGAKSVSSRVVREVLLDRTRYGVFRGEVSLAMA